VSKSRLNSFFEGIIIYKSENKEQKKDSKIINSTNSQAFIEYSHFIDIITLCAFDIVFPEPEPTPIEKVKFISVIKYFLTLDAIFY
jgi:hypothetical protein